MASRGARFKHGSIAIVRMLNELGYNTGNFHYLLDCAPKNCIKLLSNPRMLTMEQVQLIAWALGKPLGYTINILLQTPDKSPNWLDSEYTAEIHIDSVRHRMKYKRKDSI